MRPEASDANEAQKYAKARSLYRQLAEMGDPRGQERWDRVDLDEAENAIEHQNYGLARSLFQKMADRGEPFGDHGLARMARLGLDEKKDMIKAIHHYQLASIKGQAQTNPYLKGYLRTECDLSDVYFYGMGVPFDLEQAEY